ncbi:hypothetical protein AB0I28_08950 [Phytomonospora sp. NPDC050363]|uniref:hypothetical protein n=1 Tax=Phytomonospora sp. NPDC050363 TaxID=3155642 RepID=UPI0033CB2799
MRRQMSEYELRPQRGAATATRPDTVAGPRDLMALQRTAGNRAVGRLVNGYAPTVQRCGPDCDKEEAAQGVPGMEAEFPAQGRAPLAVQRAANFAPGALHQVNNLADAVINGTPAGVTWPMLNGTQFWSSPVVRGALARPTVNTVAAAGGGFDASVTAVGNNTGSWDETVLAAGPWRLNTTKAAVVAAVPALAAACGAAGNTTFRASGNPSDNHMFTANRRHEDHHATDHEAAFNATIAPWDAALTAALTGRRTFHGATQAAAEAALWAAVGGTPEQVADAYFNACLAAVVAYHGTAAGGPIGAPTGHGHRDNCRNSWARYRNPS